MKRWQGLICEHGNRTEILDDNTMLVFDTAWNPETKEYFDNKIIHNENGYDVEEIDKNGLVVGVCNHESILDYLGY